MSSPIELNPNAALPTGIVTLSHASSLPGAATIDAPASGKLAIRIIDGDALHFAPIDGTGVRDEARRGLLASGARKVFDERTALWTDGESHFLVQRVDVDSR